MANSHNTSPVGKPHRLQSTQNKHSGPAHKPIFWFADNPPKEIRFTDKPPKTIRFADNSPQAPASKATQEGGAE